MIKEKMIPINMKKLKEPQMIHPLLSSWNLKEGNKHDENKARFDLLPIKALTEIVWIFSLGAKKYADRNWEKGIKYSRVYAALQRHINAWWTGEDKDLEWGKHHLAHAGCCLLFLLHYEVYKSKYHNFDDRPMYGTGNPRELVDAMDKLFFKDDEVKS